MAHYDLKPPNVRTFDVTGNTLMIYEPFAHLALGESRVIRVPAPKPELARTVLDDGPGAGLGINRGLDLYMNDATD